MGERVTNVGTLGQDAVLKDAGGSGRPSTWKDVIGKTCTKVTSTIDWSKLDCRSTIEHQGERQERNRRKLLRWGSAWKLEPCRTQGTNRAKVSKWLVEGRAISVER